MNLITYASPIAIKPHEIWALSLFKGTVSHENFAFHKKGILQQLTKSHLNTINLLGKQSGRHVNKLDELETLGHKLSRIQHSNIPELDLPPLQVFYDSPLLIELESLDTPPLDLGDHWLYLAKVERYYKHHDSALPVMEPLYTDFLRQQGII